MSRDFLRLRRNFNYIHLNHGLQFPTTINLVIDYCKLSWQLLLFFSIQTGKYNIFLAMIIWEVGCLIHASLVGIQ